MDPEVLRALSRWPNVPDVFGWLELTRRGDWRIRGERISHPGLVEFIGRNYARDDSGRWFFQNGPQRVFVRLEYTPWVYRLASAREPAEWITHTGLEPLGIESAWIDEEGSIVLVTELGPGVIDDRDLARVLESMLSLGDEPSRRKGPREEPGITLRGPGGPLALRPFERARAAETFRFVPDPAPPDQAR